MGRFSKERRSGTTFPRISDTTIASAFTRKADIAGIVRSPSGTHSSPPPSLSPPISRSEPRPALPGSSLRSREATARARHAPRPRGGPSPSPERPEPPRGASLRDRARHRSGLSFGLPRPSTLLHVDAASFGARGLIVEGMKRRIGASIFTLLLMGLVGPLEASGVLDRMVEAASSPIHSPRGAEVGIVGVTTYSPPRPRTFWATFLRRHGTAAARDRNVDEPQYPDGDHDL